MPDWVDNLGYSKNHPDSLYLTGFGLAQQSNHLDKTKCLQFAQEAAKRNLIERIRVTINSELLVQIEENDYQIS